MPATTVLREAMLNLLTGSTHYFGLITSVTDILAGTVTEVNVAGYTRMAIAWTPISAGQMANNADVTFPPTTGSGAFRYVGVYSAATGGTLKYIHDLGSSKTYDAAFQPKIAAGAFTINANLT